MCLILCKITVCYVMAGCLRDLVSKTKLCHVLLSRMRASSTDLCTYPLCYYINTSIHSYTIRVGSSRRCEARPNHIIFKDGGPILMLPGRA